MEELFNEVNYRAYLENVYVWPIDKDNPERKKWIDRYSTEFLQKIINDTKMFSFYVIDELKKKKDSLTDSVYMEVELISEGQIESNLHGGWSADVLYNPDGFGSDFWVSRHILKEFLKTSIDIVYRDIEYYNELEEAGTIMTIPYISIVMSKEQFKIYESIEDIDTMSRK